MCAESLAGEQREAIGQNTRRGLRGQFERGYVPGAAPFGYRLAADPEARDPNRKCMRLVIHELEAAIVRRIFEACAAGRGAKLLARRLNAECAPAPVPRASKLRPSWAPTSIHALLANPIYRGELVWGRSRWRRVHATGRRQRTEVPESEWVRRPAPQLAIVDAELWQAANAARNGRARRSYRDEAGALRKISNRGAPGRYILSGLLVCDACGATFCAQHRERWGCSGATQRGICSAGALVSRAALEDAVLGGLTALLDPEALATVAKLVEAEVSRVLADRDAPERLRAALASVEAGAGRLVDLAADGDMAAEIVRGKLAELEAERARIRSELATVTAAASKPGAIAEAIRRALSQVSALLAGDPAGAREALRALLGGEPLRVAAGEAGYRLVGGLEIPAAPIGQGPPVAKVAGAVFEHFLLDVELPWAA